MLRQIAIEDPEDLTNLIAVVRHQSEYVAGPVFDPQVIKENMTIIKLDLGRLCRLLEHVVEDQVISVEGGISIDDLNSYLKTTKQWFPLLLPKNEWLLADVLSVGDGGLLEHAFGGPRDLSLGLQVVTGCGHAIKCGGKVVKNVSGYDLQKLFLGSHQTLGIPIASHLRLFVLPETQKTYLARFKSFTQAYLVAADLIRSGLPLAALELLSPGRLAGMLGQERWLSGKHDDNLAGCVLVVTLLGPSRVVTSVYGKVKSYFGAAFEVSEHLDEDSELLVAQLSRPRLLDEIEMVGSLSAQEAILAAWKDRLLEWQSRPYRGRLKLKLISSLSLMQTDFSQLASLVNEPLVVALSGYNKVHLVNAFPQQATVSKLKRCLKQAFDPDGCLNPFVSQ